MSYPNATHYSPHFTRKELDCGCGCKTPPAVEKELALLAVDLEQLRKEAGGFPITATNAYRCPKRNAQVGGATRSEHLFGHAADLVHAVLSPKALAEKAMRIPRFKAGGIIQYPKQGFLHVDRGVGAHRPYHAVNNG